MKRIYARYELRKKYADAYEKKARG